MLLMSYMDAVKVKSYNGYILYVLPYYRQIKKWSESIFLPLCNVVILLNCAFILRLKEDNQELILIIN